MNVKNVKSGFQLLATSIKHIEFNNSFVYYEDNDEIEKSFDVTYEVDDISLEEDDTTLGTISLNIIAIVKNQDAEMNFNLTLQGCFITEDKIETDEFRKMLEINGCATLYSIARAMILNISSQACYKAHILLPMINLFKLKEKHEEKDGKS